MRDRKRQRWNKNLIESFTTSYFILFSGFFDFNFFFFGRPHSECRLWRISENRMIKCNSTVLIELWSLVERFRNAFFEGKNTFFNGDNTPIYSFRNHTKTQLKRTISKMHIIKLYIKLKRSMIKFTGARTRILTKQQLCSSCLKLKLIIKWEKKKTRKYQKKKNKIQKFQKTVNKYSETVMFHHKSGQKIQTEKNNNFLSFHSVLFFVFVEEKWS